MSAQVPAAPPALVRPIDPGQMAFWRKAQVATGIARGAFRHLRGRPGRLPIIHRDVLILEHEGSVQIGHLAELHERVAVSAIGRKGAPARLTIGTLTSIWYGTVVSARSEISIGAHCAISWNCTILDEDMHEIIELPSSDRPPRGPCAVRIEDHVWIGAGAIVLKGVTIGQNAIVAAGAVVTRDVPPATLVAGSPARVVRSVAGWR
jgi:acetyltransferase-like isoleucine patch superfamily enzyme